LGFLFFLCFFGLFCFKKVEMKDFSFPSMDSMAASSFISSFGNLAK